MYSTVHVNSNFLLHLRQQLDQIFDASRVCSGCSGRISFPEIPTDAFSRHLDIRAPNVMKYLWGDNVGCFKPPSLDKCPSQVLSFVE
jgi:hypothetical protein